MNSAQSKTKWRIKGVVGVCSLLWLLLFQSGCIGTQAFPLYAKPGETVSLAIGAVNNETGTGVDRSNLTITITDAAGAIHVVHGSTSGAAGSIRSVFRSFPDPLSRAAFTYPLNGNKWSNVFNGQIGVLLDLPAGLAPGTAEVAWDSPNLPIYYNLPMASWGHASLEVLDGPGPSHDFGEAYDRWSGAYAVDLSWLEPNPRLQVALSNTGGGAIGGLQVKLLLDTAKNVSILPIRTGPESIQNANVVQENKHFMTRLDWNATFGSPANIDVLLYCLTGVSENHFTFYLVASDENATIDLSGIVGADPSTGVLDPAYYKAVDLNGTPVPGAVVTLTALY